MITDKSIIRIRAFIKKHKWSKLRFAKAAGLPESTVRRLFYDDFNPTMITLRKMEAIVSSDFFNLNPAPIEGQDNSIAQQNHVKTGE